MDRTMLRYVQCLLNFWGGSAYSPSPMQTLVTKYAAELGIEMVPFQMMTYIPSLEEYLPVDEIPKGLESVNISGTELRARLKSGAVRRGIDDTAFSAS